VSINPPVINDYDNPPQQMAMNTNVQLNNHPPSNQQKVIMQQAANPADVQQVPRVNLNLGNLFGSDNSNPITNKPRQKYGQSIQISSGGYSGSSGISSTKTHAKKNAGRGMSARLLKLLEPKYKAPKHYAHKKRIRKCHGF
jgi:hypothetical protein